MDLDQDGAAARGLRRYVHLVAEAVGVGEEASTIQFDDPVSAYLALDRCSPQHPDQDLALLWDERQGWALGVVSLTPFAGHVGCVSHQQSVAACVVSQTRRD